MIALDGNRIALYQWDINQRVEVSSEIENGFQIHFASSADMVGAYVVEPYEEDGKTYANIPNILLQDSGIINVYYYDTNSTESHTQFQTKLRIIAREKPQDYVYNETGIQHYIPAPDTAEVGQVLAVKEIDADGNPTAWECADASGGSDDAVLYTAQELTTAQQSQARGNIGAGTSDFDGDYNSLDNKPTIPEAPEVMTGATDSSAGAAGLVPAPAIGDKSKVLTGAGTWAEIGSGEKKWRLIKTITITESIAEISAFTTDNDGNEFDLSSIAVLSNNLAFSDDSTATSGTIRVWISRRTKNTFNNNDIFYGNIYIEPNFPSNNAIGLYCTIEFFQNMSRIELNVSNGSTTAKEYNLQPDRYIERIGLSTNNYTTVKIGAGSIIEVWGIDA